MAPPRAREVEPGSPSRYDCRTARSRAGGGGEEAHRVLSARAIYQEIRNNDETYRLFCSVAAKGEAQGGWENGRIAALTRDGALRSKIARHGEDEDKHG